MQLSREITRGEADTFDTLGVIVCVCNVLLTIFAILDRIRTVKEKASRLLHQIARWLLGR